MGISKGKKGLTKGPVWYGGAIYYNTLAGRFLFDVDRGFTLSDTRKCLTFTLIFVKVTLS